LLKIFELLRGQLGVPGGMLHSDHALERMVSHASGSTPFSCWSFASKIYASEGPTSAQQAHLALRFWDQIAV
jgi:hypothetical protein